MNEENPLYEGLLMIHRIITRGLKSATSRCHDFEIADYVRHEDKQGLTLYVTALQKIVHSHHLSEDEIVFPYFRNKIDAHFNRLAKDHLEFKEILEKLDIYIPEVKEGKFGEVSRLLNRMDSLWGPHAKLEEDMFSIENMGVLPAKAEQKRLVEEISKHGAKNANPGYLVLPFMLYTLDETERSWVAADLPWVVRKLLLPVIWKAKWSPMKPFLSYYSEN